MTDAARYAPIGPIEFFEYQLANGVLGDYNLLLAHDVLRFPNRYANVFTYRNANHIVILDNGVVELGEPLNVRSLIRAADIVRADVVCLPDALNDIHHTIRLCNTAEAEALAKINRFRLMAIPQGKTFELWKACATI